MIVDSMSRLECYTALHPRFSAVLDFLRRRDIAALPDGRYAIDGEAIFMTVGDNQLRPADAARLEAHDRYIDLQILVSGSETFGWCDRAACRAPCAEMDAQADIQFFDDRPTTCVTLQAGQFAIFFPGDAHAPLIGRGSDRKGIVKVLAG